MITDLVQVPSVLRGNENLYGDKKLSENKFLPHRVSKGKYIKCHLIGKVKRYLLTFLRSYEQRRVPFKYNHKRNTLR